MRGTWIVHEETYLLVGEMSGLVKVRYCRAPARLQKNVGSSIGAPVVADCLEDVSTGVRQGLQFSILAQARIS